VRESHVLSSAIEAISQHSKEKPVSDEHSLSVERRRTDKSAQKKKASGDENLRTVERRRKDQPTQRRNKRWLLTFCRTQKEGQDSTANAGERAIGAHDKMSEHRKQGYQ
jgi:hypothetical protein